MIHTNNYVEGHSTGFHADLMDNNHTKACKVHVENTQYSTCNSFGGCYSRCQLLLQGMFDNKVYIKMEARFFSSLRLLPIVLTL